MRWVLQHLMDDRFGRCGVPSVIAMGYKVSHAGIAESVAKVLLCALRVDHRARLAPREMRGSGELAAALRSCSHAGVTCW